MVKGEIIEINGKKAMVDEVLGGSNYAFHYISEDEAVPVLEEFPEIEEPVEEPVKRRRRKKA